MLSRFARSRSSFFVCAVLVAGSPFAFAQTAAQLKLGNPRIGDGTPFDIDTVGRSQGVHQLDRSVVNPSNNAVSAVRNITTWDINPGQGYLELGSTTTYNGWQGSGVSLDTRYAAGVFDTFTVNAGNSGFANGDAVQLTLALTIQVAAQTDAFKFQTGSNWLKFTVQERFPAGTNAVAERFSFNYDVTVYEFIEKAVINGTTQFDNTTTYVNGQGDEADNYAFTITLDVVVGESLELALLLGDFVPNNYSYDMANLVEGTRQDLGNGQEDFGNAFNLRYAWDIQHAAGFAGLQIDAASGFITSARSNFYMAFADTIIHFQLQTGNCIAWFTKAQCCTAFFDGENVISCHSNFNIANVGFTDKYIHR